MNGGFWIRLLVCAVVIGVLAAIQPWIAVGAIVLGLAIAAFSSMGKVRKQYENDPTEGLSLDAAARIRPLMLAQRKLNDIAERNPNHPAIKVIGKEAVLEADDVIAKAAGLLKARSELLRAGSADQSARIEQLRAQIEATTDLPEKDRLEAALDLAESAKDHDEARNDALAHIDAQLEEARGTLEEMQAELGAALTEDLGAQDELRETLGRLKSLGTSLEEAKDLLSDTR